MLWQYYIQNVMPIKQLELENERERETQYNYHQQTTFH